MSEKQTMRKVKLDQLSRKLIILLAVLLVVCIGLFVWIWSLTAERQQLKDEIAWLKANQDGVTEQVTPEAEPTDHPENADQPENVLEETPAKYFDIVETGDNACTITGYSGKELDVVIPAMIDGRQVTRIGEMAFYGQKITSVVIPGGVVDIENRAFERCDKMISVTIPETVISIGDHAFENCGKLTNVSIPASVEQIGSFAFSTCDRLKSVEFAEGLKSIGEEAFKGCHMENISLPQTLEEIGRGAFLNCYWLASVELPKGLETISEELFAECYKLGRVELPDTVKTIGSSAFSGCVSMKEAVIPDGVESIGKDAFAECDSLVVFVSRDSYAAKWAMDNDIDREYVEMDSVPVTPDAQPEGAPAGEAEAPEASN